jgi:hypothetical protein
MIEESPQRVPTVVAVLGSLWLVAAAANLAHAGGLVLLFGVIRNFAPGGSDPLPPPPPLARPLYWAFEHYLLTGSIQGALALIGIYSGVQFLRLKRWARAVLEAAGSAGIALSAVLGIWRSQFWLALARSDTDAAIRLAGGLLTAPFFAVLPVVFVWLLRSRMVRPAFVSGGSSGAAAGHSSREIHSPTT